MLHDGPSKESHIDAGSSLRGYLASSEPRMPSLRRMHEIVAADPRAQAKFFLLMSELHYRFILGVERLHIGRTTLARPMRPVQDEVASSLQPCIAPGTTDVQAPLEAQGRGFTHAHAKGHSVIGATLKWLRNAVTSGLTTAVRNLREALLGMATTVQYDAAREPARQLGVELRPEPFNERQQRQSRMDGGEEEDGTEREHVELAPPVEQPHLERERQLAAAESRLPRLGSAAYREVPLTGAFQSSFPAYRQRSHFGDLGDASEPCLPSRRLEDIFTLDDEGQIVDVLLPDGTASSEDAVAVDAKQWASHFAQDVFNNHCTNHEHNCTETCIKYVKKKLEAKQSLRSNKVPSCRFWFFRVVTIKEKRRRRRGKPLVREPYIADTDDRNQEFRCQVRREQPFRSTTNDVAQVTDSCNVDYQFLSCAPPLPPDDKEPPRDSAASPLAQPVVAARCRLRKKTPVLRGGRKPVLKKTPKLVSGLRVFIAQGTGCSDSNYGTCFPRFNHASTRIDLRLTLDRLWIDPRTIPDRP